MANGFSTAVTRMFDVLLLPFGGHAGLALTVISVLCGVVIMLVFRSASDQEGIRRTRRQLQAGILEMRIYQDDLVLILRALLRALRTNVTYLRLNLVPLVAIAAVVAIVFVQLDARFGRMHLRSGDTALVTVALRDGADVMSTPLTLGTEGGAALESPPVRAPASRELTWQVRVERADASAVTLDQAGRIYRFPLAVGRGTGIVGNDRGSGALDALIHPGLPALPAGSPVARVTVQYRPAALPLFGWRTHWLVVFLFWSFVGALIPKLLLGVEI